MPPKKKKAPAWVSSKGRSLLERDIRHGLITADMNWEDVFEMRPEFAVGENDAEARRLFEKRLKDALKRGQEKQSRADQELVALVIDRTTNPRPAIDARGRPQWEGSLAQTLLKQDVAAGVHVGKTPTQYHATRPEYTAFPVPYIGKKVDQEVVGSNSLGSTSKDRKSPILLAL